MAEMTAPSPQKPPMPQRANSTSSAGTAMSTGSMGFAPRFVPRPEPAYVSPESAADHVSRLTQADQYDVRSPTASPCGEAVAFSKASLQLLNGFLDALLYNILGKARGTSMSKLRPAIKQVLSGRLARDALRNADEEMQDLVDETESSIEQENARAASRNEVWHLEEAFKLMRLRVMVFCKLGVFDDENEETFLEEDDNANPDLSILDGPSAVFLASILEFLTERLLDIAGEAAFERSRRSSTLKTPTIRESRELTSPTNDDLTVEEMDVNKIALNPGFARLWRTWRKSQQHMYPSAAVQQTRDGLGLRLPRRASQDPSAILDRQMSLEDVPEGEVAEHDIAANIPLPLTDNDVNEIEIPGLAKHYLDDGTEALPTPEPTPRERWISKRPGSALFHDDDDTASTRPALKRLRSNSMPMLSMPGAFTFDKETGRGVVDGVTANETDDSIKADGSTAAVEEDMLKVQSKDTADHLIEDDEDESKEGINAVGPETPFDESADNMFPVDKKLGGGIFAAAAAGAAALATAAVATVVGTSRKDTNEDAIKSVEIKPKGKPATPTSPAREVGGTTLASATEKSASGVVTPASMTVVGQDNAPVAKAGNDLLKTPSADLSNTPIDASTSGKPAQPSKIAALRAGFESKDTPTTVPQEPTLQLPSQNKLAVVGQTVTRDAATARAISPSPITPSTTGPIPPRLPLTVNRSPTPSSRPAFAAPQPLVKEQVPEVSPLKPVDATSQVATMAPAYVDDEYDPFAPTNFNTRPKAKNAQALVEPPSPVSPISPSEEHQQEHDAYTLEANPRNQFYPSKRGLPPSKPLPDLPRASKSSDLAGTDAAIQLASSPPTSPSNRDTVGSFYPLHDGKHVEDAIIEKEDDAQSIGMARTSNIRIQSHSPTPDQVSFGHENRFSDGFKNAPTSDVPNGATTSATVQPDELISINRLSSPGKYAARSPSPLTPFKPSSVKDAPEPPERTSSRGRDRAMVAPSTSYQPTHDSRMSVSSTYSQPEGGLARALQDSPQKDVASATRGVKVPPLQTSFVPASIAEEPRPSSGQKNSRGSIVMGQPLKKDASDDQKGRDFDDFVKSGETVKYTLTPDGLRDNRAWDGPVTNSKYSVPISPGGEKTMAVQNGQRASPPGSKAGTVTAPMIQPVVQPTPPSIRQVPAPVTEVAPPPPPKSISQTAAQPVVQPVARGPSPTRKVIPRPSQYRNSTNTPLTMRPSTINTSNPRNPRLVPREARVVTERLADFADFMRSTAPSNESQGTPFFLQVAQPKAAPAPEFKKQKSRLQAREADTRRTGASTDLIEFIRQGPSSTGDQNGRTPNGTAANRSTLNGAGVHHGSSNATGSAAAPAPRVQSMPSAPPAEQSSRKQYRNKDPYAIDFLDNDDYEDDDQGTGYGGPVNAPMAISGRHR